MTATTTGALTTAHGSGRWTRLVPLGITLALVGYLGAIGGIANGTYFAQSLLVTGAVFGVLAVSLDLVAGMTGLYSLGHAGLFAIGAYTTALLAKQGWNVFLLLPVSILVAGLVGALLGTLSLRVSGLYFAIMTFIFSLVVPVLLTDFVDITGGLNGIAGPTLQRFPPGLAFLGSPLVWVAGLVLLITVAVVWSIRSSPMYPVLLAIRDAEPFAAANGVRTAGTKVAVFALSAGLAGMAGWAFSFTGYISPSQFTWTMSVNILVMVIFGGMNTRLGPLIGAAFVSTFPVVVALDPLVQEAIFGLIFLVVIVFYPTGVMGLVGALWRRLVVRPRDPAAAPPPVDVTPVGAAHLYADRAAPPDDDEYALVCEGVEFSYTPGNVVVDRVDLRVRRGTIHGLIGPNGSGKSTMVNLVSGRLRPDAGTITLHGTRVERQRDHTRAAHGLLRTFQTAVLVRDLPVRENVTIGLYHREPHIALRSLVWPLLPGALRAHRRMRSAAAAALQAVGLDAGWNRARVADVPHGIEQLTQLAAAQVGQPSVLILDEPLAGLSVAEVEQVSQVVTSLRDRGVTIIVVEHQTHFIFEVCDEVTVLAAGELVATGPADEVRADDRVREVYLGQ